MLGLGYLLFYSVIAWTSLDQVSYVFILPLLSILVLYKDPKFIKVMMWITLFILVSSNMYKGLVKGIMDFVSSEECVLEFAIVLCCYACTNMAIKHLVESDGALTSSIEENLARVVKTVEQVKVASNEVVDGVTVVRELADENKAGADDVVEDMVKLSDNNSVLNDKTVSSIEMTKVIDNQVTDVAGLMEQVVDLINASVEHADTSAKDLVEVVDTTNRMSELSKEVENILVDFKKEFGSVKDEISISDVNGAKKEYTGEVTDRNGNDIYVIVENEIGDIFENRERHKNNICKLNIVVDNVLYCWNDIVIRRSKPSEKGQFKLHIETNPQVYNRRKYPRMPITNTCTVKFEGEDKTYQGHMVNISANGFAISIFDSVFADAREKNIVVSVDDFDEISAHPLEGCIIRSSNNDGEYIVGCRMPEDVQSIKNYVSKNYCN